MDTYDVVAIGPDQALRALQDSGMRVGFAYGWPSIDRSGDH